MAILEEIQDDDKELLSQITGLKDSEIRTIRSSEAIRRSMRSKGASSSRSTQPGDGDTPEEWDLNDEEYDSEEEIDDRMDTNAQDLYDQLEDDRLSSTVEAGFDLVAWFLPFAFMFEMLNLLVQKQYNQETTFMGEVKTLIARLPPLILLIWWNLHEKRRKLTQLVMLVVGTFSGCYLAYLVNKASYTVTMARAPALGTLWMYAVVRLELSYALISLLAFGAYVKYAGLKLVL